MRRTIKYIGLVAALFASQLAYSNGIAGDCNDPAVQAQWEQNLNNQSYVVGAASVGGVALAGGRATIGFYTWLLNTLAIDQASVAATANGTNLGKLYCEANNRIGGDFLNVLGGLAGAGIGGISGLAVPPTPAPSAPTPIWSPPLLPNGDADISINFDFGIGGETNGLGQPFPGPWGPSPSNFPPSDGLSFCIFCGGG